MRLSLILTTCEEWLWLLQISFCEETYPIYFSEAFVFARFIFGVYHLLTWLCDALKYSEVNHQVYCYWELLQGDFGIGQCLLQPTSGPGTPIEVTR